MADLLDRGINAVSASLIDFGYPDADPAKVRGAHERWIRGEEAADIVERFAADQFKTRPDIFGSPPETDDA